MLIEAESERPVDKEELAVSVPVGDTAAVEVELRVTEGQGEMEKLTLAHDVSRGVTELEGVRLEKKVPVGLREARVL